MKPPSASAVEQGVGLGRVAAGRIGPRAGAQHVRAVELEHAVGGEPREQCVGARAGGHDRLGGQRGLERMLGGAAVELLAHLLAQLVVARRRTATSALRPRAAGPRPPPTARRVPRARSRGRAGRPVRCDRAAEARPRSAAPRGRATAHRRRPAAAGDRARRASPPWRRGAGSSTTPAGDRGLRRGRCAGSGGRRGRRRRARAGAAGRGRSRRRGTSAARAVRPVRRRRPCRAAPGRARPGRRPGPSAAPSARRRAGSSSGRRPGVLERRSARDRGALDADEARRHALPGAGALDGLGRAPRRSARAPRRRRGPGARDDRPRRWTPTRACRSRPCRCRAA